MYMTPRGNREVLRAIGWTLVCTLLGLAPACTTARSTKVGGTGGGTDGGRATGGAAGGGTDGGPAGGVGGSGGAKPNDGGADLPDGASADMVVCGSASDPKNCGTCGHDCTALPNVNATAAGIECRASVCFVPATACVTGYGHCSSRSDDGCEASLTDANNCGACGIKCSGATALCTPSSSGAKCASSCVSPSPDLCVSACVDLKSDPRNCGTCGHDCTTLTNVAAGATGIECRSGACYIPPAACTAGNGHCSTRADDGCETSLRLSATCGTCTTTCASPTGLCSTASGTPTCSSSCVSPSPDLCGSKCVSLATDPTNCGACNHNCTTLTNVKAGATGITCLSGVCSVPSSACASGHAHCSSRPDDGCEADLSTPATCGSCSLVCSGTTPLCSLQSTPASCLPNCSGTTPNVCGTKCVNNQTDVKNCGTCNHDCTALTNVKPGATAPAVQCVSGVCVIQPAGCVSGFGHCTSNADAGCETDLTKPANCGSCTNTCVAPTALCSTTSGTPTCSSSCVSPNPDLCGSKCVSKTTDPTNCGTCGNNCTVLGHITNTASVSCSNGGCVVPQAACTSGFANCSAVSNDVDGCETQTNTATNCGGCGVPCPATITNGTASCATGTCIKTCSSGAYMCNGACIANSVPCSGSCASSPNTKLCNGVCVASTVCCAPAASAAHFVDAVVGTDATDHGESGACAFKTITYALAHSTGAVNLAPATYSGETWPLTLNGVQSIACNPSGAGRATIKMASNPGSATSVITVAGTQNLVTDCIISGNSFSAYCVDLTTSGASSTAPSTLTNLDLGFCNAGVIVEPNVINVKVQTSTIHDNGFGIQVDSGSAPFFFNNTFTTGNGTDYICQDNGPGPNGAGSTDVSNGFITCSHCLNCPF